MIHFPEIGLPPTMLDMALRTGCDACVECCRLTLKQSGLARVTADTFVVDCALVRGMARLAIFLEGRMCSRQQSGIRMTLPGALLSVARIQPQGQREDAET
jgi:hypothetical protein